jgi:NADH-quinone oxidoreductase subunit H
MRFLFFFFAEWANLYIIGALVVALFLGGWNIPQGVAAWASGIAPWLPQAFQVLTFIVKDLIFVFLIIQLRWTLPRIRMDQLMEVCWKYLVPISFVCVMGVALWMLLWPHGVAWVTYLLIGLTGLLLAYYAYRVYWQLKFTKSAIEMNPFV